MIVIVSLATFLVRLNSTFNRNVAHFFSPSLPAYFTGSISYIWLVGIHAYAWYMAMNSCWAQKKDEVNGENIPCFNYLYFNSLPAPTANLIPWMESARDNFFNLRIGIFIGNEMPGRRAARCRYKAISYCCEQNANINSSLPSNIRPKSVYKTPVIFVFEIMGKRCSKI